MLLSLALVSRACGAEIHMGCAASNDLYVALEAAGADVRRASDPVAAIRSAPVGSAVFLLADAYPAERLVLTETAWREAEEKQLRVYAEFPSALPGQSPGATRATKWERLITSTAQFGAGLPEFTILMAHDCHYVPMTLTNPLVVVGKVAGFNRAVFGLPKDASPILARRDRGFVATTKLSGFAAARFAPAGEWETLWNWILREMGIGAVIRYTPTVGPTFGKAQALPPGWQRESLTRSVVWYNNSGLLVSPERRTTVEAQLRAGAEVPPKAGPVDRGGDGRHGVLEGYSSEVRFDGHQRQRLPLRADCQAESAMVYASEFLLSGSPENRCRAENLLGFLYGDSGLHRGVRGDPEHPAYGLISWGAVAPAWEIANYGDDNARAMLATLFAAGALKSASWDEALLKALLANLRTTGRLGFRGDRIDIGPLEQHGWKHYENAATVNYSPHFEAYPWACFLWAYRHTKHAPFLEKSRTAIAMTMKAFPTNWRWNDNMERAHMLLPLAWLTRIEDTPEHRAWLATVAHDLLEAQDECGALQERFRGGGGHYQLPASNEAYGTTETPLLQENGDPVSDQLYVSGFALLGLHEAAAILNDERIRWGADKLAEYLARIQTRSERYPYLDGTWFRAFDYRRWEPWGSSGDVGWGAWCIEAGWAQAWGAAIMALREQGTTLWDLTATSTIARHWDAVQTAMARNAGGPWKPPRTEEPGS